MLLTDIKELVNSENNSPFTTWMYRGFEDVVDLDYDLEKLTNKGQFYLRPAKDVGLPDRISEIAFANDFGFVFFTIPEKPSVLYYMNMPSPFEPGKKNKYLNDMKKKDYEDRFFCASFNEEIISICVVDYYVFILTGSKGRVNTNDTFKAYRMLLEKERGVADGYHRVFTVMKMPVDVVFKYDELSFIVVKDENSKYCIYMANSSSSDIYCGYFVSEGCLIMERLIQNRTSFIGKIRLLACDEKVLNGKIKFFVLNNNILYELYCANYLEVTSMVNIYSFKEQSNAVSCLSLKLSNIPYNNTNKDVGDQEVSMFLVSVFAPAYKNNKLMGSKILTIDRNLFIELPLMGGGDSMVEKNDSLNMLDYDLGYIDVVAVFKERFIVIGKKGCDNWYVLLFPRMGGFIDNPDQAFMNYSTPASSAAPKVKKYDSY